MTNNQDDFSKVFGVYYLYFLIFCIFDSSYTTVKNYFLTTQIVNNYAAI
jgi:hypothetical protein